MFIEKLIDKVQVTKNPSAVGLDPKIEYVPTAIIEKHKKLNGNNLTSIANAILEYNKIIIDAIYDIVPIVKPQSAYYEALGIEGIRILIETIDYARSKDMLIILDAKRNDIDSTAKMYSSAYLGRLDVSGEKISIYDVDALTVNAYLGKDGIIPFLEDCDEYHKGLFMLVKTSNLSSSQFQDLEVGDQKVYMKIAEYLNSVSQTRISKKYPYSSVGAVVGGTYPADAKILRQLMPNSYFLVPGYGYQGGNAKDLESMFNKDGLGAIISSSRKILLAYKTKRMVERFGNENVYESTRLAALEMKEELQSVISSVCGGN